MDASSGRRAALTRFVPPQDFVWLVLFSALALFGPDRSTATTSILIALCVLQIFEPKLGFFLTAPGNAVSFSVKLILCWVLMGWTDGVSSGYYWLLLLPVLSAATNLGAIGTIIATILACAAYLSFLLYLGPEQFIPPEELREFWLRVAMLPVVGFLTHQLAEANRRETRRHQAVAEQLAAANKDLQEARAAATRSERLVALGQLSAGLAHELRNPLGTMKASAEMLLRSVDPANEVAHEMAGFITSEVDRTNSLITRFLDFARPLAIRLERGDIGQVIDRAVEEVGRHQPPYNVAIYKNYSPDIRPFPLDAELMGRVFYNLLLNAAQASPPRGSITVKTRAINDIVEIAVIDCGSGIDAKHLENIFNPFFTTKSTGVGLGLAIVSKIVDEHGGKISVESEPGSGSVFRVYLSTKESATRESG